MRTFIDINNVLIQINPLLIDRSFFLFEIELIKKMIRGKFRI